MLDFDGVIDTALAKVDEDWEDLFKRYGPRLRSKAKTASELLSWSLEEALSKTVPGCRVGAGDHEADIYINGTPVEIKNTQNSNTWRGGKYSKRSGEFLLVSYTIDAHTGKLKWFVIQTELEKEEWVDSASESYYATSITLDYVLNFSNKNNYRILRGNVRKSILRWHPVFE